MSKDFFTLLKESAAKRDSLLCVGLDPLINEESGKKASALIIEANKRIIGETADYAACFKPNIAFYEVHGPDGLLALQKTISLIPEDIPVILDAKRGDIGDTAKAYAQTVFGFYRAHAVTVSPYMGKDSIQPFLSYWDKGVFVLCRTTNPGSDTLQCLEVCGQGETAPLYISIAREARTWGANVGFVVAGNDTEALSNVRKAAPDAWFLAPGIGCQGGVVESAIAAGLRRDGSGMLINVSRAIANADKPREAARDFCERIRAARARKHVDVVRGVIKEGCFKTGSFTLKSGLRSPFYIDLRKIISNPGLLARVASCYAEIIDGLDFARIAGIPFAGIPLATAVSILVKKPMLFPRLEKKAHGTGNEIEGSFEKGETVLLLDDLITTGKSKFEALDILENNGLVVTDLVVLVERGKSGREELRSRGVRLHACFGVLDFIDECYESGNIGNEELAEIKAFLESE